MFHHETTASLLQVLSFHLFKNVIKVSRHPPPNPPQALTLTHTHARTRTYHTHTHTHYTQIAWELHHTPDTLHNPILQCPLMKYTNGQVFVWILTFVVAKFVWDSTCRMYVYSFVLPAMYFTAPVTLRPWSDWSEKLSALYCHIWLLHQISQIHHLSCIISYLCFVSRQSGQRYYLKCILSYTCFTRSGSGKWPAAYSVIRVCYTRLVRDTTCPVFYHTCVFVSHQLGQRHHLSCVLSYLRFCFTPAGSETLPAVYRGQPGLHGVHSAGQHLPGPPGGQTPACAKWRAADQDDGWLPVSYTSQTTCTALSRSHEKRWW